EISLQSDGLDSVQFMQIRNPLEDIYLWGMKNDTVYFNEEDGFLFKKEIEKPEYIIIGIGNDFLNAIVFPSEKAEIVYADSSYIFQGKNSAGLNLLNKFDRPVFS